MHFPRTVHVQRAQLDVGVTGLWYFANGPNANAYILGGFGGVNRRFTVVFSDPAHAGQIAKSFHTTVVSGGGIEVPSGSTMFARAEYRVNLSIPISIHQFRVGAGLRF
jgi:opacity protein-like surface antigen